jgi:cytochrome c peroxidase
VTLRASVVGCTAALLVAALLGTPEARAHRAEHRPIAVRPETAFTPPPAGSYELPLIQGAPDGRVVDLDGRSARLASYTRGRITLLSLIYTYCIDPTGCPLAYETSMELRDRILADRWLHGRVRFVSLSFDPLNDTPSVLRAYAGRNARAGGPLPWQFLTTRSPRDLAPILEGLGQEIEVVRDDRDRPTRTINHMLKLFLLDRHGHVREIYSTAFLHPEAMLNDIKTLVLEEDAPRPPSSAGLGLPALEVPHEQAISPARVALGRKLFLDRRLSPAGTMSCAMCHIPEQGFTANELATSVGVEGRTVRRNAPTLLNVAFHERLFHDGREVALEDQVWGPLLAANEMGNSSIGSVVERLRGLGDYAGLFEAAFDGRGVSAARIGDAIAAYERTLVAGDSRFDRWRFGGDASALSPEEQRGFALFTGKARCAVCHTIGDRDALFTDHRFHNTGIGWRRAVHAPARIRVELIPGAFADLDRKTLESFSEPRARDLGRYEITLDPKDRWAYRTPGLRNVALTSPYMHDGSLPTLEAVVEFYDRGGIEHPEKSPLVVSLGLDGEERGALVAFLRSLTGSNVQALVDQARRARR